MTNGKADFRTMLSSLDDDPFLNHSGEAFEPTTADEGDSIFSVSRTTARPTTELPPEPSRHPEQAASAVVPERKPVETAQPECPPHAEPPPVEDAVLNLLSKHGVLTPGQIAQVWPRVSSLPAGTPPWRAALALPDAPQEQILAVAAHAHKVPFVDLREHPPYMLVMTLTSLPQAFKKQCHELRLLPFACAFNGPSGRLTLKLATSDPLRSEVEAFVRGLKMDVELFYAPASMLSEAIRSLTAESADHPTSD